MLALLLYISLSISSSFSPSLPSSTSFSTLLPLQFFDSSFFTLTTRSSCPSPGSVFALRCCSSTPSPLPLLSLYFLRGLLSSMRMLCVALWHACLDSATSCSTCPPPSLSLSVHACVCANESGARVINGFYLFKALQCTALQFCRAKGKITNNKKKEW